MAKVPAQHCQSCRIGWHTSLPSISTFGGTQGKIYKATTLVLLLSQSTATQWHMLVVRSQPRTLDQCFSCSNVIASSFELPTVDVSECCVVPTLYLLASTTTASNTAGICTWLTRYCCRRRKQLGCLLCITSCQE